jgi:hypothetical protein
MHGLMHESSLTSGTGVRSWHEALHGASLTGHGGGDLIVEIKAYSGITLAPPSPYGTSIGFGCVEEHLLAQGPGG